MANLGKIEVALVKQGSAFGDAAIDADIVDVGAPPTALEIDAIEPSVDALEQFLIDNKGKEVWFIRFGLDEDRLGLSDRATIDSPLINRVTNLLRNHLLMVVNKERNEEEAANGDEEQQ